MSAHRNTPPARRLSFVYGALLALAASLPGAPVPATGSLVGFGTTNVLDRFATRSINTNLDGPDGFQSNFSGCCVDPATSNLLVVLRGPNLNSYAIQIYAPDGAYQRQILLTSFDDVEAICVYHPASNLFALAEEGRNAITIVAVTPETTSIDRGSGRILNMGLGNLMNAGIEGLTWDAGRGCFYAAKEYQPHALYRVTPTPSNVVTETLFNAALITNLCADFSDLHYDAVSDHLLILSHESQRIVETTLDGQVLATLPIALDQPEGLTLSATRSELFVIGEPNQYQRLAAHWREFTEGSTTDFSLTLSQLPEDPDATTTVQVAAIEASAIPGLNITPTNGIVQFTNGLAAAFALHVPPDDTLNPPRDFAIVLTNATDATLSDDATALLRVVDPGILAWTVDTLPGIGHPFRVTLTAQDTNGAALTGYTNAAALSLTRNATFSRSMIASNAALITTSNAATATRGLRFRPSAPIFVTHLRYTSGDLAALWTDTGTLLALVSGPIADGEWQEVALTNPVPLNGGQTYRVASASASPGPRYFSVPLSLPTSFADGTIRAGCETNSLGFPGLLSGTAFAVDIRYTREGRAADTLIPATAAPFVAGHWSEWLTITSAMENVVLEATASSGHTAQSPAFDVLPRPIVALALPLAVEVGAGLLPAAGRVTVAFDPDAARTVNLVSANTNALQLPASVVVTGGTDTATFDVYVPARTTGSPASAVFVYATAPDHAAATNSVSLQEPAPPRGLMLRVLGPSP